MFRLFFVLGMVCRTVFAQTPPAPAFEMTLDWQTHTVPNGTPTCFLPHPDDETLWIVCSASGFSISNDSGQTYRQYGTRACSEARVDPQTPSRIGVVCSTEGVYFTEDRGASWTLRRINTSEYLQSIHISPRDGTIWVGPRNTVTQHGLFRSVDHGVTFQFYSFGNNSYRNLIPWAIIDDPETGTVYVGTEIGDHPQPYKPPELRSLDRGQTWEEMVGLPFHVVSFAYSTTTKEMFALEEGPGVYKTADQGKTWKFVSNAPSLTIAFDPKVPTRLWASRHGAINTSTVRDGVLYSPDLGVTWIPAGLPELSASIALGKSGSKLYAATFPGGIRSAAITAPKLNFSTLNGADGELASFGCNPVGSVANLKLTRDSVDTPLTQTITTGVFPFSTVTCNFRVPLGMAAGDHAARLTFNGVTMPFSVRVVKGTAAVLTGMTTVLFTQPVRYVPGDIVSLFGYRLSKSSAALGAESIASIPFPAQLNQTKVTVLNAQNVQFPAAVQLAFTDTAGNSQINVHLPTNLADGSYRIRVDRLTAAGAVESSTDFISFTVGSYQALFLGNATYPVFLQNITQDPLGRVFASTTQPAKPGDVLTLYATGMGVTNPPLAAGTVPTGLVRLAVNPQNNLVTAGDRLTPVSTLGGHLASPQFPGLYQMSFMLPPNLDTSQGVVLRHEQGAVRVNIPIPVAPR